MPQLTIKNDQWGTTKTQRLPATEKAANRASLGTVRWEGAPAEKNGIQWCGCGREQEAPNEAKSRAPLSFSASGATCMNFLLQAFYPNLGQALWLESEGSWDRWNSSGTDWLHLCGKRMEREQWDEPQGVWLCWGLEATGGFPIPRDLSASSTRELRNSLEYSKWWPERRLVSPQTRGNHG